MPDTQQIDAEVAAIIAAPHNDLPPSVRVDETVLQPTATTTAQPLVMTADAIPAMLDDPAFQALPFERKSQLAEDALAEAGRQVSQSWDKEQFVDWGKFAEKVRSKVGEQDTLLNQTGRAVRDLGEGAINMGTSLAKDAGTVAISAADAINPGGSGFGVPALKTMGSGFMAGLESLKASGKSVLAGGGEAETNLQTSLDSLKKDIDEGNLPLDDPQKFSEWLTSHDTELADARSKFFADAESGLTRGLSIPEPTEAQRAVAKTTGLASPDNQKLIAAYMQTRSPETWKALQQQLFKTPEMQAAEASKADVLKTPGAVEFNKAFGEGASEHLLSASNPLMIAGFALPMLRGAAGAEAAAAEAGLMGAAKQVATGAAKAAPEMAGFGAVQQLEQNPQSTAGEVAQSAAEMAGAGAILAGATGGVGTIAKRGLNAGETGNTGLPAATVEGEILFEAPKPPETPPVTPQFVAASTLANKFGGAPAMSHVARTQALVEEMNRRGPATGTIIPRPQKLYTAAELQGKQWPEPLPPETAPASGEPTAPITQETSPAPSTQTEGVIPNETTNPNPQPSAENLNVPAATRTAEAPVTGEPPPSTTATTPPEGTSNKDAVTLAERRASGILTDPEQAAPISHQEILDQGRADIKAAQESGKPSPAREIAARLRSATAEDRTISRRENGILMAERRQTRNDQIDASKVIADPSATPAAKAVAKADWDAAEAKIAELNQAAKDAGGVWGGWGAFRKQVIAEDWSFDKLQSDQQAQLGRPLEKDEADALKKIADEHKANSAVVAKNAELTQENQRLTEQNANLQSMLDKAGAKREPKSESKTPRDYVPPKKPLGANFIAKSSARRADIAKEISELLKTTNIGVNPVIAAKAAEYMGHLIAEGAVKFAQVAVKMKDEFKDLFDDTELMAMFESAKAHAKKLAANADRDIAGERAATLAGLKQRIAEGDPKSDLGRYANAIARQFIDEGIHELEPLNAAVHGALKEVMPEITLREAEDAWNGYGIWKELDKSPEKVIYRQLKNEGLKLSAWQDLQKSPGFKKKTGRASEPPTAKARKQDQENREYMRRHGINAADPETQAKGALDAIKTRLRNKKADLDFARATGQRIVDKTGVAYDAEAKQLKDEADAAQILYDAVFPKEPISDAETLRRATIVAEKELENWRAKLKDAERGIFAKRQGPMSTVPGERLSQIKSEIGAMEAEVAHLKDIDSMFQEQAAQEKLQKTGDALEKKLRDGETALENDPAFGPDSAAVTALKARNDAIRKLIADAKDKGDDARTTAALEKSIADLSDKLARGEYEAKQRKASFPDTERNARLREERDALRGFLADVRRGPKKSKDEIRLSAMIAGAARRKANLLDRIATKNFKPTPKKPPPNANTAKLKQMESDLRAARLRNVKIERDYNNAKAKYELENEPAWRWLSRQGGRFARAAVLASAKIYTKLAMLGWVVKPFATLAEETLGATGARMLLPETMRNAPGEGTGSTLLERMSDYARGYRRGFAEMKTAELEGQTTNQSLHSDQGKFDTAPHWEDYLLTHPHMAIKAPAWEAAFSMSEGNRIRHAGYTDLRQVPPEELANLQKEAAKDADHHIAINENKMNKMVSEGLGVLERQGAAGTVAADLLRMDAPIRKIPTNIAAGGGKYLFGSLAAPIKMAWLKKYRAGEITPEDYNNVARTMKKGMTFATLAAIAAVVPGAIKVGGVYVRDEKKRKPGDLKPNEMEILGVKIPEAIGHADIGAAAQAAGTAVRAFQKHREGGGGVVMSSLDGVSQAALGLTQDLPAIKVAGDVGEAWKAGEGAKSTASRLAKNVIPFPVRFAAEQQDYKGDQSVLQQLLMGADKDNIIYRGASFQTGIPDIGLGLPSRQDLPRKKSKR